MLAKAIYALPMSDEEVAIFQKCTGRKDPPKEEASEVWIPVGRRGRKSAFATVLGIWEGGFRDHTPFLAPGERAMIPVLAHEKFAAGQIRTFAVQMLEEMPVVRGGEPTADIVPFSGSCDLHIRAAKVTAGRSRAVPCVILEEVAFFPKDESANPDKDILEGIEPAMAQFPYRKIIGISSPYAKSGLLWERYNEHYGVDGDRVLVWKAPTLYMNPSAQIAVSVNEAYKKDPTAAAAEYGAEFRDDIMDFLPTSALDECIEKGVTERPKEKGRIYFAFFDPSGGSQDAMTVAVAHHDHATGKNVLDWIQGWAATKTFDPDAAIKETAEKLEKYDITWVTGDRWGGEFVRGQFRKNKINYIISEKSKSDIYQAVLPIFMARMARLLDHKTMRDQFIGLDRMTGRSGKDSIDHRPGGHDDYANVAAGALELASRMGAARRPKQEEKDPPKTPLEMLQRKRAEAMKKEGQREAMGPAAKRLLWRRGGHR